jgi:hypothetical protein
MRTCVKCGGSWMGKSVDTRCAHDFDLAPQPEALTYGFDGAEEGAHPLRKLPCEKLWIADGWPFEAGSKGVRAAHPTREGAIAAWQTAWRERRDRERADAEAPVVTVPTARESFQTLYDEVVKGVTLSDYGKFLSGVFPLSGDGVPLAPADKWQTFVYSPPRAGKARVLAALSELADQGVTSVKPEPVWGDAAHFAKMASLAGTCDCGSNGWRTTDWWVHAGTCGSIVACESCGSTRHLGAPEP